MQLFIRYGLMVQLIWISAQSFASGNNVNERVNIGYGQWGAMDSHSVPLLQLGYEFVPLEQWWGIRPIIKVMLSEDDMYFGAVGLAYEYPLHTDWVLGVSFSGGYLHRGQSELGKRLGYDIQFYTNGYVSYQISDQWSGRLEYGHISNAHLDDTNPGNESVIATLVFSY